MCLLAGRLGLWRRGLLSRGTMGTAKQERRGGETTGMAVLTRRWPKSRVECRVLKKNRERRRRPSTGVCLLRPQGRHSGAGTGSNGNAR
ncbi:hypothetical protein CSUI_006985 [Cystoisospora suis]|uniref:Uncharacterized protein n=1 Tax=Cystoisospora suis TaxID=483139 RepID=A0A2C6KFB7_9APIC|nr:hypothetical protein CSUI_006985 [Cystoisospora suis]